MNRLKTVLPIYFLLLLIAAGILLRFYNLNWGAPFYFHPDERNIASSVIQLSFPKQLNPHFFAYGDLPIYITYFTAIIINSLIVKTVTTLVQFDQAILIGRIYSAIISVLTLFLLYKVGTSIKDKSVGITAVLLATYSVGFIQFAHFSTFETWLSFFSLLLLYVCLKLIALKEKKYIIYSGILLGILSVIKVSSIVLFPLPIITLIFQKDKKNNVLSLIYSSFLIIVIGGVVYFVSSPFSLFDFPSFLSSIRYEASVASGYLPVFYTQSFYHTTPILFQFTKIYPFFLNPIITALFVIAFIKMLSNNYKTVDRSQFILLLFFLVLFLSQAFLFAKWTRYMLPTLPFIYLIISIWLNALSLRLKRIIIPSVIITAITYSFFYLITVLNPTDTRIQALLFTQNTIPPKSTILSETYDLGITPFNSSFPFISLFNFYDLDSDITKKQELYTLLQNSDYIILPSQRLMNTRLPKTSIYPDGHILYQNLFSGELGYKNIYETPCAIICKFLYNNFYIEDTAYIFDRPGVYVFKKNEH